MVELFHRLLVNLCFAQFIHSNRKQVISVPVAAVLKVEQWTNLLCLTDWLFLIAISAKQPGTNVSCILVSGWKEKFFDISLKRTPVDWKTLLLITEVTVQHTNLKFSEESKLCSSSQ